MDTNTIVRALYRDFAGRLPEGVAGAGEYKPKEGDRFIGRVVDVPNGTYRITGVDWLIRIAGRRFVGAMLASAANKYGGKDVVHVPGEDPIPPTGGDDHEQKGQAA